MALSLRLLLWLLVPLGLVPAARAQEALPRHVQVELVAAPTQTNIYGHEQWDLMYGGRVGISLTPALLWYGAYWPSQRIRTGPHDFDRRTPRRSFTHWNTGLRTVVPLSARYGLFGTLGVGVGRIQRRETGGNAGAHLEYWLVPTVLLRGGIDSTWTGDFFVVGVQLGAAVVPYRW